MYSLKNRLTRNLIINMLVVMSALLVMMYFSMQQLLQDYALTRLQHDAESLISAIEQDQNQAWRVDPTRMSTVYDRVKSGHYYRIDIDNQRIRSRSLFDEDFPVAESFAATSGHYVVDGPWQETWLVWYQQVSKNGQLLGIRVAEDLRPVADKLLQYTEYLALLILFTTLILIFLQQRTLAHSFRIFEWLRQNLATIRHKETDKSGVPVPREIKPLVTEIEALVDQLRNRINRTRHAIGNLAHELKRPLQLLSLQQDKDSARESIDAVAEIKNIVDRELRRAKISGSQSTGTPLTLAQDAPRLIEVLARIYPQVQIEVAMDSSINTAGLDRDDMLELLGNLLDNACKYARQKVQLTIEQSASTLIIIIEDDGAGLSPQQIESIRTRGTRLDESVEGHGLGLGICTEILDSYRGSIKFADSALGGLKVSIEIPSND
jgi:signal transduction histidine kinase